MQLRDQDTVYYNMNKFLQVISEESHQMDEINSCHNNPSSPAAAWFSAALPDVPVAYIGCLVY